ncbi:probable hexosyltransferase MUCI70 isoform X2 [Diospyros lotus]|uniref:probable hexosyltransferase MUCI70 isoform X2 n=1 Tax=Diospyros lotus TaxID=55363 RepID=UPI00225BCA3D|nr:probable hexosyltransferase MUCI70 isoform X2 [Diospyros lotus]
MNGGSFGLRTGSNGSLQQVQNGMLQSQSSVIQRKPSKTLLSGSREKERFFTFICRCLVRRKVGMLILVVFALLAFVVGLLAVNKDASENYSSYLMQRNTNSSMVTTVAVCGEYNRRLPDMRHSSAASVIANSVSLMGHPCNNFAFPPPPPPGVRKRIGPRPCPVCYLPAEQAKARMPSFPSVSPVLHHLTYFHEENPIKREPHGGSDFGGFPSLKQRNNSFNIEESMTVHCGFVKGCRPGYRTGFDVDEADLRELELFHEVIVASAIFGNYDVIQQPENISEIARKNVRFYMFIDEETEAYMKNSSRLDSSKQVGLWRIIVVHNVPYMDPRRNGKIPKLLLHRLFPNVRYSIWIDGKLQLVVDPYQILERFLWRQNASFAISRHYSRFNVFEEAEANKAAGKYDNASINYQIEFYKKEGLTPYSDAKLPITSDVPEGCVIIKEHIPITNLFTCLWFNEVDRFTSRDQLSFSTVRDRILAKVDWTVNMFMDCERRNFVIQAYHRDMLNQMPPPVSVTSHIKPALVRNGTTGRKPMKPALVTAGTTETGRMPTKRSPVRRGRDRRSGSRRHRKVVVGNRDNI